MNRQNFLPHLALAVVIILIAAFAGQIRHWESERKNNPRPKRATLVTKQDTSTTETRRVYEDNDILVKFKAGTDLDSIKRIASQHNDYVEDNEENIRGLVVIDDQDGQDVQSVLEEYRDMPEVEYAEPDYQITTDPTESYDLVSYPDTSEEVGPIADAEPNDPLFANQWALKNTGQDGGKPKADINALKAWEKTTGSKRVVVAVLDSGVDYTHSDLASNIWHRSEEPNLDAYDDNELGMIDDENGFDAVEKSDPMDENGHGTHCAGVIGADGNNSVGIAGVNWKVEIMPLKFMNKRGFGSTKAAIEAINYVIDRKKHGVNVRIISASWGSTQRSKALEDAIRAAGEEGILFVAASGNSSEDTDKRPHYPSSYKLPNVVSVAALDRADRLASFSNYGAKTVHVAAPGATIISTWLQNGFRDASGTSMATPHVAGIAALILAKEPNIKVEKLKERLIKSTDELPELQGKVVSGGRINAAKAVRAE